MGRSERDPALNEIWDAALYNISSRCESLIKRSFTFTQVQEKQH